MTEIVSRRRAMLLPGAGVLALALLTSGCASNSSKFVGSNDLFDSYDTNNDNTLSREEWDQTFMNMDTNGDGAVTLDEYYAGGGG